MFGLTVMIMAQAATGPTMTNNRVPDAALISKLESKIVMPPGAGPLSSYVRAYTEGDFNGKDLVIGQMIDRNLAKIIARDQHQPVPPPVRRTLEKEIPPVFDGGCGALIVIYDVAASAAPRVVCNPQGPH